MRALRTALGTLLGLLAIAGEAGLSSQTAAAAPDAPAATPTARAGSYTRYTRRLEDETVRILTPEIGGATKTTLAAHGLDLWGAFSIGEWRQGVLRWAPTTEKALSVLVRRTEVLWSEEQVNEAYGSTILQLGSVHAMQKGLVRVLDALGVASPAPVSAHGIGAGSPAHLPTLEPARPPEPTSVHAMSAPAPAPLVAVAPAPVARPAAAPAPVAAPVASRTPAPAALPRPTAARSATPAPAPRRATPVAAAPAKNLPPAQSPYELAAYQGALAKESYRVLFPEIEGGAQAALAARRNEMRNAPSVAEWKRLLSEANPSFAKAAAVLERRAEVLRGEARVLDLYESPHTQRAAVYGLQSGLEKILALYGK